MRNVGVISEINNRIGGNLKSIDFFIVINNGEIDSSFDNEDLADMYIENIDNNNIESMQSDEETPLDFGFNDPYKEHIVINSDVDLEDSYITCNNDEISYQSIAESYINRQKADDILNELDDIDIDLDEDDI